MAQIEVASITGIDLTLPVAGLGARSYAFVIDWHIRLVGALAWFGLAGLVLYGDMLARSAGGETLFFFAVAGPALAIYLLYHPVLEVAMNGRTPGKRMAGVRVVSADGHAPSVGALLIRNMLRLLDSLPGLYAVGLGCALVTRQSVRIGDLAAGTVLVYDETPSARQRANDLHEIDNGTVARLGLERLELVRDLLDRWDTLDEAIRRDLAQQLLAQATSDDGSPAAAPGAQIADWDLRATLKEVIG